MSDDQLNDDLLAFMSIAKEANQITKNNDTPQETEHIIIEDSKVQNSQPEKSSPTQSKPIVVDVPKDAKEKQENTDKFIKSVDKNEVPPQMKDFMTSSSQDLNGMNPQLFESFNQGMVNEEMKDFNEKCNQVTDELLHERGYAIENFNSVPNNIIMEVVQEMMGKAIEKYKGDEKFIAQLKIVASKTLNKGQLLEQLKFLETCYRSYFEKSKDTKKEYIEQYSVIKELCSVLSAPGELNYLKYYELNSKLSKLGKPPAL